MKHKNLLLTITLTTLILITVTQQIQIYQLQQNQTINPDNAVSAWLMENYGVSSIDEIISQKLKEYGVQYTGNPFTTALYPGQLQAENITGMYWYTYKSGSLLNRTDVIANPLQPTKYIIENASGTIIWKDGINGTVYATGTTPTEATNIINWALGNLTSGRIWKEKIVLKGDYTITSTIKIPSYTILEIQGKIFLADNSNCKTIENSDINDGNSNIEIIGGIIDGNGDNQSGAEIEVIHLQNVTKFIIANVHVMNALHDGYDFDYCQDGKIINCIAQNCGKAGFHPGTQNRRMLFVNCYTTGCGSEAYGGGGYSLVQTSEDIKFVNCISYNDYYGLRLEGSRIFFQGSIIEPTKHAIYNLDDPAHGCNSAILVVVCKSISSPSVDLIYLPRTFNVIFISPRILVHGSAKAITGLGSYSQIIGGSIECASRAIEAGSGKEKIIIKGVYINSGGYYPIDLNGATNCVVEGCILVSLASQPLIRNVGQGCIIRNNVGFVTENSGTATDLADGSYIAHGLAGTPTTVTLTCLNSTYDGVPVIVSWDQQNSNSTHIAIHIYWSNGTAITDPVIAISWRAEYQP